MKLTKQQSLTLVCDVPSEARQVLRSELFGVGARLQQALRGVKNLHCARLLLVPGGDSEELLLELGFDGGLAPLLTALWASAGPELARVFRFCHSQELPTDAASFSRFCQRHARRADAAYAAHDGLSVAVIHNDAALDQLLQTELDRAVEAETVADHGPLEIANALQARARAHRETWLGTVGREPVQPSDPLEAVRGRLGDVLLALAVLPLLEIGQAVARAFRAAPQAVEAAADSELLREQGPIAQVFSLKPGRLRLRIVKLLLWLVHAWFRQSATGPGGAVSHLHSARWLILPGSRLLFLGHSDLGPSALLASRSAWERRLSALIWLHAQGFPGGLRGALRAERREAALRDWLRRTLLPSPFWYTAYPGLGVSEIERNHRVRELLGRSLDRERAVELCVLL